MSKQERLDMITNYIKSYTVPILIENISSDIFNRNAIILPANISIDELNGHYEGIEFLPPNWYLELEKYKEDNYSFLVINGLSDLPKEDQLKFGEILKYNKVGVFELPKNCVIIITAKNIEETINSNIYSMAAVI